MRFIMATGGSGGHLIPALKTAGELRRRQHDVRFLGAFSFGKRQIRHSGFDFDEIQAQGLDLADWRKGAYSLFLFARATAASLCLLRRYRPDAVVGFGGYGAFPVVLAAVFLRYPTMIHEQNVVPGRANKVLSRFVDKVTISFPQAARYWKGRRTLLTGCPSHRPSRDLDPEEILKKFRLEKGRKTLLILGGSQGSQRINEAFVRTAAVLKDHLFFQVIHICGKRDYGDLQDRYAQMKIPFALFEFWDEMDCAYSIADLVMARAGAVTVTELIRFQRPAILIPYPYAGGHQRENARVLEAARVGRVIEEKGLSVDGLQETILDMLAHSPSPDRWQEGFGEDFACDAAGRLADEAIQLSGAGEFPAPDPEGQSDEGLYHLKK
ncbi:MAG: undecaprenyldiphospho-muramoylpentapeptide beta-N-acetylglucosaminyltransferase [Omnitrophica WOR_2 bacterium RIFCSPHIGHO2_02_FULL_50_17]|nr:MAG: undecaprenyldiphospho-muramoylpentapeptide beta-N-acetylglucosaminyltransferase [Omnitrophica WOR_2 bacterium RIFCSPHIGHO2_02_FULL_50_17]